MLAKSFNNYGKFISRFLTVNQRFRQEDFNSSSSNKEFLVLGGLVLGGLYLIKKEKKSHSWIYRDDIGAPHGIHGYEEQVNSVGQHHGHFHWTHDGFLRTFDSASVRRGFKVWLKSCQSCHGAYKQKYDIMVEKIFDQVELIV
jgi:cytochrome c1